MATTSLQAVYEQAQRFLEENDTERAIAVIQHILRHFPNNLEAHRLLGEAYLVDRQFDKAEGAFRRVLNADPENIQAHVGIGITYERQGKLDRAVSEFEQALEIKPDMTELRTQLLRLYADAWGSEHAQLRLSRPGLARLYAKGHMLSQAIQEFRSVVADQPDRFDARVGLVEALWHNGQEDLATAVCDEILAERQDVLKANLLLGYIKLSAGDPNGEQYWRTAQQLDPYQNVAHILFGNVPDEVPKVDVSLPAWNEAEWRKQREIEAARAALETSPVDQQLGESKPTKRSTVHFSHTDELLLASLLGITNGNGQPASTSASSPVVQQDDDDERMGGKSPSPSDNGDDGDDSFSFDFGAFEPPQESSDVSSKPSQTAAYPLQDDDTDVAPFSLGDLGLEQDTSDPSSASRQDESAAHVTEAPSDVEPFDWMGTDDTLPETELLTSRGSVADSADSSGDSFSGLEPFDIGGVAEDTAAAVRLEQVGDDDDDEFSELQPFDIGGVAEDTAAAVRLEQAEDHDDFSELQPFEMGDVATNQEDSMDDLPDLESLDLPPSMASMVSPTAPSSGLSDMPNLEPFDWDATDEDSSQHLSSTSQRSQEDKGDFGSLQPFSLDDLDLSSVQDDDDDMDDISSLPPSLQPFTLDDSASAAPKRRQTYPKPQETVEDEGMSQQDTSAYSWQTPSAKGSTDFLREKKPSIPTGESSAGSSIFAKLKQRREEIPIEEPPPLPEVTLDDDDEENRFFSDDDVSLRDGKTTKTSSLADALPTEASPQPHGLNVHDTSGKSDLGETAAAEPAFTPFSLDDLGVSAEELSAFDLDQAMGTEAESPAPFSFDDDDTDTSDTLDETSPAPFSFGDDDTDTPETAMEKSAIGETAAAEPAFTPFSLDDLGVSAEELSAFDLGETTGTEAELPAPFSFDTGEEESTEDGQPFSFDTGSQETDSTTTTTAEDEEEPVIAPLSLAELGLTEEEIAALNAEQGIGETGDSFDANDLAFDDSIGEEEEPVIAPLSLAELGLTEEEIAELNAEQGVGETRDSFDADDLTLDEEEEPVIAPLSLAELGLTEEEIAALNAEQGVGETVDSFDIVDLALDEEKEPVIAPLSLAELGLTEEEIAALNAEQGIEETVDTFDVGDLALDAEEEPVIAPLSLAELGLTEEEIAALNAEQGVGETVDSFDVGDLALDEEEEPVIAPLSLAELGLTEEEIAALNAEQGIEETVDSFDVGDLDIDEGMGEIEPEIVPLSLADLGLSEEEITAFNAENALSEQDFDQEETLPGATVVFEETEATPFSLEDLDISGDESEGIPFEEEQPPVRTKAPETQLLSDLDLQPFSLDDLDLGDSPGFSMGNEQSMEKLGLTTEELSGLDDFGGFAADFSGGSDSDEKTSVPDTGDKALDQLIMLGQRQGFVDLTDIINVVDDPVAESERIEDIGRALYRAGIEIRDGDEIIDMEDVEEDYYYEEEDYEDEAAKLESSLDDIDDKGSKEEGLSLLDEEDYQDEQQVPSEYTPIVDTATVDEGEPVIAPLSLAELGLSEEEIAMLGLDAGGQPTDAGVSLEDSYIFAEPELEPIASEKLESLQEPVVQTETVEPEEEPIIAPLSLAELGLTEEEIAMLGLDAGGQPTGEIALSEPELEVVEASEAIEDIEDIVPEPVVAAPLDIPDEASDEIEIAPLSLAELGLTEEEIAMLGLDVGGQPTAAEPTATEPTAIEPGASDDTEIAPLSLAELGLTEEEIAMLGLATDAATESPSKATRPEPEGLGLSDADLAKLGGLASFSASTASSQPKADIAKPRSAPSGADADPFALDDMDLDIFDITADQIASATTIQRTKPREPAPEEVKKEPTLEDLAFVPAALEELDDIWDLPAEVDAEQPARVVLPPKPIPDPEQDSDHHHARRERPLASARSSRPTPTTRPAKAGGERAASGQRSGERRFVSRKEVLRQEEEQSAGADSCQPTGDEELDMFMQQFATEPDNFGLCFAVAHMGKEKGHKDAAIHHYQVLIKQGEMLNEVLEDLKSWAKAGDDEAILQRLYRLIGDTYIKQKRFPEGMAAYKGQLS